MDNQPNDLHPRPGKRPGQKYKSLLVIQYLLKNADDENAVTMSDILSHLSKYGITSGRCPPELQRGYTRKVPGTAHRPFPTVSLIGPFFQPTHPKNLCFFESPG